MTDYRQLTEFLEVYRRTLSLRACRDEMCITYHRARALYQEAVALNKISPRPQGRVSNDDRKDAAEGEGAAPEPIIGGRLKVRAAPQADLQKGKTTRFILTCAQNNTEIHEQLWDNLNVLAKHYHARIIVARTVYNRFAEASDMDKKLIVGQRARNPAGREYHWFTHLEPYFVDERLQLAKGLVWCGEANIMPTASQPLAGFDTYTGRDSTVLPHNKIAMRSVASHYQEGTKIMYTTGTLTKRNYIQRKAGQLAEFHHCYGALLVEVDAEGTWFCRQLNADSEGTIHDWDLRVAHGKLTEGNRLEAIGWGDLHETYRDPIAYRLAWKRGGLLDELRPKHQFMHDLIDFRARNPHNIKRNLNLQAFVEYCLGHKNVRAEIQKTAVFLYNATRPAVKTMVVSSNHNNFLVEWLERLGDFRKDPTNAVYFLEAATHLWRYIEQHEQHEKPDMTRWAMYNGCPNLLSRSSNVQFLDEDESFIICPDAHGGIECGMHGHQGPNGTRGAVASLAKMGRKANIGDKHSAGILDGLYVAGIMGSLNQGYNSGPGSWSQSNIFTYPNGKRAIQTIYDGKVRAR